ncbi:hypothetical protein AB0F72_08700 [Actinoplanes sp. NPDC023936]|uniref:hypothetical protein n=1 Tax=Actinoplanes sp. NPDC023936 TaxID=3154910 RepID=UPI003402857F
MSAYDNDPRVIDDGNPAGLYVDNFKFTIFTNDYRQWWATDAGVDSACGPFSSADEAIHSLIGDPQ